MKKLSALSALALAAGGLLGTPAVAAEVSVAVAANFTAPMEKLAAKFTEESGHRLIVSYGATGKLYAQIKNGAPFEVLLSADQEHPKKLVAEKLAVSGSEWTYAIGKLALWSSKSNLIDSKGEVLKAGQFKHLAIANPKLAPYGVAAQEVLVRMGLWEKVQDSLVLGESITQAHQFVATGNAVLGFVAFSQIKKEGETPAGSFWLVPQSMYAPIRQSALLLARGRVNSAAKLFLEFLKSEKAKRIIEQSGYDLMENRGTEVR
jgi:molybdate transport system substrate-binding protein